MTNGPRGRMVIWVFFTVCQFGVLAIQVFRGRAADIATVLAGVCAALGVFMITLNLRKLRASNAG